MRDPVNDVLSEVVNDVLRDHIGYEDTGAAIVHDAAERGLLDLQWYTGNGIQNPSFPESAYPNDPAKIYQWKGIGIGTADSAGAKAFAESYKSEYNELPPSFAAEAYDAAWIGILAAIAAQGSGEPIAQQVYNVTDPDGTKCIAAECLSLVEEGMAVSYDGATGQVNFDKNGDPSNAVFAIWKFTADGIETVKVLTGGQ